VVDARLAQRKSHTPAELAKLWDAASLEGRCWMALGLCGAMDNADVAELRDELDLAAGVVDYRRRKRGRKRRIIPLPEDVVRLLRLYRRPPPAGKDDGRFFLTPTGLPLGRMKISRSGQIHRIDYMAMVWARLLVRAGIRAKGGDRRGFRSMRTTHANLAPPRSRDETEIVMGHAKGILVTHYLERDGMEGLRRHVDSVWEATGLRPKLAAMLAKASTSRRRGGGRSSGRVRPSAGDAVS
jgi:integrase